MTLAPDTLDLSALRPPTHVMRLRVLGASFPTRLSFLRTLVRALHDEQAHVQRNDWQIDERGFGHAVYSVALGGHVYSLVAFTQDLPADQRTDRVIATAWDAAFVLYDGIPDAGEVARLKANAPLQEAGRFTERDLVLSRANKSVRLFECVVQALRSGAQPQADVIRDIGYLMRTTAVYGNGKFGIADRSRIAGRPVMDGPFMAEMLTVYLIRGFTHDLVEHLGGAALDRRLKRHLGIGNATGLGMAPFLVNHPNLLNNWILAREAALAECLAIKTIDVTSRARLADLSDRVARHLQEWQVPDGAYAARIAGLRRAWAAFQPVLQGIGLTGQPFRRLAKYRPDDEEIGDEFQELVAALILEVNSHVVDGYAHCMTSTNQPCLDPAMLVQHLRERMQADMEWALGVDFKDPAQRHQFWYVSEEKQEPRLGLRYAEPGADLESPLDIARQMQDLFADLEGQKGQVADFLLRYPQHRFAVRRAQNVLTRPYAEIQDNLIGRECLPIDMLRAKLAFFGASKFDPKSDRWTRITLAQGAPLLDELAQPDADDWWLPVFEA